MRADQNVEFSARGMRQTFRRDADSSLTTAGKWDNHEYGSISRHKPALIGLTCCGVLPKLSTFGSQKCLRRRIRSKTPAGRSQKCYFGEGIGHFRAQKSAIFGETFAGASRGLYAGIKMTKNKFADPLLHLQQNVEIHETHLLCTSTESTRPSLSPTFPRNSQTTRPS
jgi:hypothetical protein